MDAEIDVDLVTKLNGDPVERSILKIVFIVKSELNLFLTYWSSFVSKVFSSKDEVSKIEAGQRSEREGWFFSKIQELTPCSDSTIVVITIYLQASFCSTGWQPHQPRQRTRPPPLSPPWPAHQGICSSWKQYFWFQLKSLCSCLLYIMWIPPQRFCDQQLHRINFSAADLQLTTSLESFLSDMSVRI